MRRIRDAVLAAIVCLMAAGFAFGGSAVVHFPLSASCTAGCDTAVNTTAGNRGR